MEDQQQNTSKDNQAPVNTETQDNSTQVDAGQDQVQQQSTTNKTTQAPEALKKAGGQPSVTSEERVWALVAYIPLIALMALVLKPRSDFLKLHGRQGLLIFLIFFFSIFVYLVPYIGPVMGVIIHLAMVGIAIFSMYQAFIGNWWKVPVLGDIAELIPVDMFAKVTREAVMGEKVSEEIEQKGIEEEQAKAEKIDQQYTEVSENDADSIQQQSSDSPQQPVNNKQEQNVESAASQQSLPIEGTEAQSEKEEDK